MNGKEFWSLPGLYCSFSSLCKFADENRRTLFQPLFTTVWAVSPGTVTQPGKLTPYKCKGYRLSYIEIRNQVQSPDFKLMFTIFVTEYEEPIVGKLETLSILLI